MDKDKKSKNGRSGKSLKKVIVTGVLLLAAGALVLAVLARMSPEQAAEASVAVVTVSRGTITETVDSYGTLEAQPSVTLAWESEGGGGWPVGGGGHEVKKGDVLMELSADTQDPAILQAQTELLDAQEALDKLMAADTDLQTVMADLEYQEAMLINKHADKLAWNYGQSSEERIDAVRANYDAACAEVWKLEDAYDAVKSLEEDDPERAAAYEALEAGKVKRDSYLRALNQILGIPFDIAVETDFNEYDQQKAVVAEARVAYNRYVDGSEEIEAAQAAVQALENTIDEARIVAPFDGTVTSISAVEGDVVTSGTEALRIDNLGSLVVEVNVPQAEINQVEIGQEVEVSFDAISVREYTGFVESKSDAGVADDNGVVQFTVVIKMEDADEYVKPGFTTIVKIVTAEAEDALLAPNEAVTAQDDGTYTVTKMNADGSTTDVVVEIGAKTDAYTQIVSGEIAEGDQLAVVTTADSETEDGMPGMGIGSGGILRRMMRN
jgi:HlyD family secretion protein